VQIKRWISSFVAVFVLAVPAVASATTYTFSPPGSGTNPRSWSDPTQWSPNGVPGAGDTAIVALPAAQPSLQADNVTVSTLQVSGVPTGGVLLGAGITIQAGGSFEWQSGVLSGMTITIPAGATMTIDTNGAHWLDGTTLLNQGTSTWTGGSLNGDGEAVFRNQGTLTITAGATSFDYGAGLNTCDFYNPGTLIVSGSGTTTNPAGMWGFHNSGTITFTGAGILEWQASSNTQHTLDDGGSITGNGMLLFDESAQAGETSVVTLSGTTTVASGATLALSSGAVANVGTSGATVQGPGTLLWTGGQITGNDTDNTGPALTWGSTLQVHMTGSASKDMQGGYVISNAPVVWDQGQFGIGNDSYFTNKATFTANGDLAIAASPTSTTGHATLENRGTFVKATGSGSLTVNALSFLQYGTLSAASGAIVLVTNGNGPNVLEAGSTISGAVTVDDEVSLAGASTVAAGATLEIGNDGDGDQGLLDGSGTLGGAGTVKIDGGAVSAGAMQSITFAGGGNVAFTANAATTTMTVDPQGSLTFAGTTKWTGGTLEIVDGTVTNSGVWTASTPGVLSYNTSSAIFSNAGTFTADPGPSATLQLLAIVQNAGTFVLHSGTTQFGFYGYTQTAGTTSLAGGGATTSNGATPPVYYTFDIQGGSLTGSGTIDAPVTAEGTVAPGASTSAGTLTITQTYTQSATGKLAVALGGVQAGTQYDALVVGGDVQIDGTLSVSLLGGYVPAVGSTYKVLGSGSSNPDQGTFATVTQPNGVTLKTTYDPNDVTLGVTAVSIPDAGPDAAPDAGSPEAGGGDGGAPEAGVDASGEDGSFMVDGSADDGGGGGPSGDSGGCSTGAAGSGEAPGSVGVLAILGVALAARSRRRRLTR